MACRPKPGSPLGAHDSGTAKFCRQPRQQLTAYWTAELTRHSGSANVRAERFSANGLHADQAHEQVHFHAHHAGYYQT